SLMSPRVFSQSRSRVFELNFMSSSDTESPLDWSFSARWLPMNPFPPVIRTFEILFHPFTAGSTGGTLGLGHDAPSWDIPGRLELLRKRRCEYFSVANFDV